MCLSSIPGAEALVAGRLAAVHEGAAATRGRASTEAAVLVTATLILPVSFQMPGGCPQQVKALPAHWQASKLRMPPLALLIPAHNPATSRLRVQQGMF